MKEYKVKLFIIILLLNISLLLAEEIEIYSDTFQSPQSLERWIIHEGKWKVENGCLEVKDGGIISLNISPSGRFIMEFEIAFPSYWVSVIPFFTGPEDYGTLYFGGGYWESFEMEKGQIGNYVQRKDPDIVRTGGFQKIKVLVDYGMVSFIYDGKEKGPAFLCYRPASRVGFHSLPESGTMRIRNFRLVNLGTSDLKTVYEISVSDVSKGVIYRDYEYTEKIDKSEHLLIKDISKNLVELKYNFDSTAEFETIFIHIPVNAEESKFILMDIKGDNSRNNFFVIVHDVSGEQHLVLNSPVGWDGWQDVGINLIPFLEEPERMARNVIHWGGDNNQKIDFPVVAIDIGIVKKWDATVNNSSIFFKNVRFMNLPLLNTKKEMQW